MASNVLLMSSVSGRVVEPEFGASTEAKPERMLAGFPWVSAIVLYTLSWGWSLLRPNTLYWDDWEQFFRRSPFYVRQVYIDSGRPLWEGVAEGLLIQVGVWAICLATFLVFFLCGIFMFYVLKTFPNLNSGVVNSLVILFLVIPVNTARISLVVFDYSSAYFLFYLGWFVLVRYKSPKSFVLACVILFLSFKTHSFLFFILLPFLHFAWLNKTELMDLRKLKRQHLQVVVIAALPIIYVVARSLFWPPSEAWVGYQEPSISGLIRWLPTSVPFILGLIWFVLRQKNKKGVDVNFLVFWCGTGATALALMPYFVGGFFDVYTSIIALRSDWGNRHQLLMPLGLAMFAVGLNGMLQKYFKNLIFVFAVSVSLVSNTYFGSNYYLDSIKKDQVVELFLARNDLTPTSELVILDDTKRFNGRGSTYRDYEWSGLLKVAGHEVASVSGNRLCDQQPNANQLTLKSETPYLEALATRDLGLYFEVKPCSEILAQNG